MDECVDTQKWLKYISSAWLLIPPACFPQGLCRKLAWLIIAFVQKLMAEEKLVVSRDGGMMMMGGYQKGGI